MSKHRRWTPEEDACLTQMRTAGERGIAIAEKLGRPVGSLKERAKILGLPPMPRGGATPEGAWTEEQDATLRSMRAKGCTCLEISRKLGRSVRAVESRALNLKIPSSYRGWSPEDDEELIRLRNAMHRAPAIAEALGRSIDSVRSRVKALKLPRLQASTGTTPKRRAMNTERAAVKGKRFGQTWKKAMPVAIPANQARPPENDVSDIVRFLRLRDFSVLCAGPERWRVDRREVGFAELMEIANRQKRIIGQPQFLMGSAA